MNEVAKFFAVLILVSGVLVLVLYYPLTAFLKKEILKTVGVGAIFCNFYLSIAFAVNRWAFTQPGSSFLKIVLAGMFFRFLFLGLALFWVWRFTTLDLIAFIAGVLGFYVVLQFVEIWFIKQGWQTQSKKS